MASTATALTVVERVEQSPAVMMLDARAQTLVDLLPDAAAATRFRRVVVQALVKNPDLLECTPESVVLSVFEAAAQGLEPTGAAGGAHLVPYNVKVAKNPDRWEKRAQLIPDYRGVIRLVTKPPSEVVSLEARVVKEGDEFSYQLGTEAFVHHIPNLAPGRSEKPTTHVYAIARLKGGASIPDVEDRAGIERIRKRGRGDGFSPWATDWDEMGKKTIIKRISKVLPVRPEIRSILVREDELTGEADAETVTPAAAGPTKVSRLAQRLSATPVPRAEPDVEGDATWLSDATPNTESEAAPQAGSAVAPTPAAEPSLVTTIQAAAAGSDLEGAATSEQRESLARLFAGVPRPVTLAGFAELWDDAIVDGQAVLSAARANAILLAADSLGPEAFRLAWGDLGSAS